MSVVLHLRCRCLKLFTSFGNYSRPTGPVSTKIGTMHFGVIGIQLFSNERPMSWLIGWCFKPYRQYFSPITAATTIRILLWQLENFFSTVTVLVNQTGHNVSSQLGKVKPRLFKWKATLCQGKRKSNQNNENTYQSFQNY